MTVERRFSDLFGGEGRVARLEQEIARLKSGDGGGTSGGVTDDWKAGVEVRLTQLHDDVRKLLGAGVAALLVLLAAIGGLYLHIDGKFDGVDDDFQSVDQRMDRVEMQVQRIEGKIDTIGAKIDALRDVRKAAPAT